MHFKKITIVLALLALADPLFSVVAFGADRSPIAEPYRHYKAPAYLHYDNKYDSCRPVANTGYVDANGRFVLYPNFYGSLGTRCNRGALAFYY